MSSVATKVAVLGCGISGAVCASALAKNGISVTIFDSGRGPGGRMSQRREIAEDGRELLFDHGAPYFTANNPEVLGLVQEWESRGIVATWNEKFGSFDLASKKFVDIEEESSRQKYVGVPGMNSICRALSAETGVTSRFGLGVAKAEWLESENSWSLTGSDGEDLGQFKGVVASDKNTFSARFTNATGRPSPLDLSTEPALALKVKEIPVVSCFAVMLAFEQPLTSIPVKGFTFKNSEILSWAFCDGSKPGRSVSGERWVLHSTAKYAENIIAQTGLQRPSNAMLTKVAEELFHELQRTGLYNSRPLFQKAHRWLVSAIVLEDDFSVTCHHRNDSKAFLSSAKSLSLGLPFVFPSEMLATFFSPLVLRGSAFPATSIAVEEKCLWSGNKRLAICGDFCVSPNVEGAILSGIAAASKFNEMLSSL